MNVALYARVSKVGEHVKQDPEVQLRELREWCQKAGHQIAVEYVDRGISGAKASRPQLDRLMRDAIKGLRDFDCIVVWRLDRFGRSLQHLQNAIATLKDAKISFISIKEGFDLTTPMGKAFFGMLGVFAEFERDVIAERIKAGLRNAKAKGNLPGRKIDPTKGPSRTTVWRHAKTA
jgi:DNA invertase Pin-like site-specific DNA recombinase